MHPRTRRIKSPAYGKWSIMADVKVIADVVC
jgi:hypothetical protein